MRTHPAIASLHFLLIVCAVWLCSISSQLFAAEKAPNIVVMLVDDMGIMDTSLPFLTDDAGQAKR